MGNASATECDRVPLAEIVSMGEMEAVVELDDSSTPKVVAGAGTIVSDITSRGMTLGVLDVGVGIPGLIVVAAVSADPELPSRVAQSSELSPRKTLFLIVATISGLYSICKHI